jgi:hypothetical protein
MTPTTESIRTQGFLPLESDIPADLTIEQYRAKRPAEGRRRRRRGRLSRRRSR